jgi:hypothetical protein
MGRHPERTPLYGTLMLLAAFLGGLWVPELPALPLRVIAYIALFVLAAAGFLMTFRDYS